MRIKQLTDNRLPNYSKKSDRLRLAQRLLVGALWLALSGCQIVASMIGLEAREENGKILFDDPDAGWFADYCVLSITVTQLEQVPESSWQKTDTMWEASSRDRECLTDLPFRYGEEFPSADAGRTIAAKPLVPGDRYELFIEQSGGAGQADFTIAEDGRVENLD